MKNQLFSRILLIIFINLLLTSSAAAIDYWGIRNINTKIPAEKYDELNAQIYAFGFSWDRLENPDDEFNWRYIDQAVDFAAEHNGKTVFLLTPASSWATDGEPRAPNDLDRRTPLSDPIPEHGFSEILYDYAYKIIDYAAERKPSTVGYLRYGNEPQWADHWQISDETYEQDVEDFVRCMRTVYKAAHDAADENGVDIKVSHGGFYYDKMLLREWYELGEQFPDKQDSIIELYYSRYERHWKSDIKTWDDFGRLMKNRGGMPETYWMDIMAGQTDWMDWFDVHYHWKPRFIFDELAAFEHAVIDSGGSLKPWLAAEAAMQIEEAGNTRYDELFHAGDMVRKWILGIAFGLKGICTPIVGAPPDRFYGLFDIDLNEYFSFKSYKFLHSVIKPESPPEDLSEGNVFYYRFHEKIGIVDVIWADALFDTTSVNYPIPQHKPENSNSGKIHNIFGDEIHTITGGFKEVEARQEPVIIIWDKPNNNQEPAKYEPPDGYVYHGVGWNYRNSIPNYLEMMPEDEQPLLLQTMSAIPGTRTLTVEKVLKGLQHEWMSPDSQYVEYGVHFHKSQDEPYDSLFAYTDELDHYMDTLAMAFNQHGKPFFLRIGGEMNGAWNNYKPYTFPKAFRKLVEGLKARGVDNFATVWCYEPDAAADFADSTSRGWKWYPGDDVVDWFGLDVFPKDHFDPALPDSNSRGITKKGKSELFLDFAEQRNKPVYLNETTAHSENIVPDAEDPDFEEAKRIWDDWFEPFFQFIENHKNIKALNYINLDWTSIDKWKHWGDCRLEINTFIKNKWIEELAKDKYIHKGFDITSPVSVKDIPEPERDITLYPNPANDYIVIETTFSHWVNPVADNKSEIRIYDFLGKEVMVVDMGLRPVSTVDVSGLPAGVYYVRIGEYFKKFVISN